jgi:hypothetical protein
MSDFALAFSALIRVREFAYTSPSESEKIIQNNDINFDNDKTLHPYIFPILGFYP